MIDCKPIQDSVYTGELDDDGYRIYKPVERECGWWEPGVGKRFCKAHLAYYKEQYPQGWNYYPGDICPHHRYVGGCGPDYMCGLCELGLTTWMDDPLFELQFRFLFTHEDGDIHKGEWCPSNVPWPLQWRASEASEGTLMVRLENEYNRIMEAFDTVDGKLLLEWRAAKKADGEWVE